MYCAFCKGFMVQCVLRFMQRGYGTMCTKVYAKGLWYNMYCSLCKGFMAQSVLQFMQKVYDTTLSSICTQGWLFSQTSFNVYSCTCFHSAISCALKVHSRRLFCTRSVIKMALLSFVSPLPAEGEVWLWYGFAIFQYFGEELQEKESWYSSLCFECVCAQFHL